MTPADRLARACALVQEAQDELRSASFALPEIRVALDAEVAVMERTKSRLGTARARVLGVGWRRFAALVRSRSEP